MRDEVLVELGEGQTLIDLPYPRHASTREEPRDFELVTRVREALHLGHDLDREASTAQEATA